MKKIMVGILTAFMITAIPVHAQTTTGTYEHLLALLAQLQAQVAQLNAENTKITQQLRDKVDKSAVEKIVKQKLGSPQIKFEAPVCGKKTTVFTMSGDWDEVVFTLKKQPYESNHYTQKIDEKRLTVDDSEEGVLDTSFKGLDLGAYQVKVSVESDSGSFSRYFKFNVQPKSSCSAPSFNGNPNPNSA